jgi:hypothetical protein
MFLTTISAEFRPVIFGNAVITEHAEFLHNTVLGTRRAIIP